MTGAYLVPRAVQTDAPERLRSWREAHGKTQTQMAKLLGCSQATVSDVESGKVYPPDDVKSAAAKHCRIARSAWGERRKRHAARMRAPMTSRKGDARTADTA
jgi:transcriptional regulator with XRE-family HTH domain